MMSLVQMSLFFVVLFSNLSSHLDCHPGLSFVQGSLFLAGRTRSYMTGVSKAIKHSIKEANNRKVAKNYLNFWT